MKGFTSSEGAKWEWGKKIRKNNSQFSANKLPYLRNGAWLIEVTYALLIDAKINNLGWPWTADTHSVAEKMHLSEPTKIWMKIDPYHLRQKCRPMSLSFWWYKVYADIRGGSLGRGRRMIVGLSRTAIFRVFTDSFSDTLEIRPMLLYGNMQSVIGFSVIPNAWPPITLSGYFMLNSIFVLVLAGWDRATFEKSWNLIKIDTYSQQHKSSAGSVLSGNIRFVRIFARVL